MKPPCKKPRNALQVRNDPRVVKENCDAQTIENRTICVGIQRSGPSHLFRSCDGNSPDKKQTAKTVFPRLYTILNQKHNRGPLALFWEIPFVSKCMSSRNVSDKACARFARSSSIAINITIHPVIIGVSDVPIGWIVLFIIFEHLALLNAEVFLCDHRGTTYSS